ncbi:hypothetical protein AB5I41_19775 [Sphingomonas sp. MMS24-JH45]
MWASSSRTGGRGRGDQVSIGAALVVIEVEGEGGEAEAVAEPMDETKRPEAAAPAEEQFEAENPGMEDTVLPDTGRGTAGEAGRGGGRRRRQRPWQPPLHHPLTRTVPLPVPGNVRPRLPRCAPAPPTSASTSRR